MCHVNFVGSMQDRAVSTCNVQEGGENSRIVWASGNLSKPLKISTPAETSGDQKTAEDNN